MEMAHRRSARTDDRVDPAILDADCNAVLDTIETGGIAIIPTCLTYAIIGHQRRGHCRDICRKGAQLQQALRPFRQPGDVA